MAKYETLDTIAFTASHCIRPLELPEVVHLDDPALMVMIDFKQIKPPLIAPEAPVDQALNEMKISGVHLLLVADKEDRIIGLISSEDILGEKPITLLQERRINRAEILTRMVMTPAENILAFDFDLLRHARVGNVVNTLKKLRQHYALVVKVDANGQQLVRGLFSTSQISKQLHMNINNVITEAGTVAELHKRHT